MKTLLKINLFAALCLFTLCNTAQESYTIKMNMKTEGLPAEYAAFGDMDMVTYMKGKKLKTERTGMMSSSITYFDGDKMTSLNDGMGNKFGFTATKAELEANNKNEKTEKPKIEYFDEKKTIAGYECTKAVMTTVKDKKENKSTFWITDKIKMPDPAYGRAQARGQMDISELRGYPLSMEMTDSSQGMEIKMVMTTTEVSTAPLNDDVFAVNTEGYKMMTYKEMLDKQKAMQGAHGK